ncbi:MAG: hypothetical protein QM725_01380 [Lacibacter sp.]
MTNSFIFDTGGLIVIQYPNKSLMIRKEQVKTIDIIDELTVRLDIGEGPLKNIYVRHPLGSPPNGQSATEIVDDLIQCMAAAASQSTCCEDSLAVLNSILLKTGTIQNYILTRPALQFTEEPTLIDESNPNIVYKGWHNGNGVQSNAEWAIQRITRSNDLIASEWAHGNKLFINIWSNRAVLPFYPIQYGFSE